MTEFLEENLVTSDFDKYDEMYKMFHHIKNLCLNKDIADTPKLDEFVFHILTESSNENFQSILFILRSTEKKYKNWKKIREPFLTTANRMISSNLKNIKKDLQ